MSYDSIYTQMCKKAMNNKEYIAMSHDNDILNFPLEILVGYPSEDFLKDVFAKYQKLLQEFPCCNEFIFDVKILSNGIIESISWYKKGRIDEAYKTFESCMPKNTQDHFCIRTIRSTDELFRMRSEQGLKEEKEFHCLPKEKRYLCSANRYSIAGFPCFYVGYSKNDCKVEISQHGSIVSLKLKEDKSLKVIDLTFDNDYNSEEKFIKIWPLIAACNMNYTYPDGKANFHEEYIIPELFAMYVVKNKEKLAVDGFRYYSTRNRELDILGRGVDDYRNIAFFPKGEDSSDVKGLMELFDFGKVENI